MDALNMAAVGPPSTPRDSQSGILDLPEKRLPPRVKAVLTLLFDAFRYACDLEANPWDFATEIDGLRRFDLTNGDLRWLVQSGLLEHGIEVTLAGDAQRSFQHPSRLTFSRKTCFVLSPAGAELADRLSSDEPIAPADLSAIFDPPALAIASPPSSQTPKWDRDRHELRIGSTVVKRYKIPADDEEAVLAAFEESNWAPRIDDPFARPSDNGSHTRQRLQRSILSLNRRQKHSLLHFLPEDRGVRWEFSGESDTSHDV